MLCFFFFFNDTATTEIYTLSLHDALPISMSGSVTTAISPRALSFTSRITASMCATRSEEHTSELQSLAYLVCRLLLEKKNNAAVLRDAAVHEVAPHDTFGPACAPLPPLVI